MIRQFARLTSEEQELLLKAPALVSVLTACSYNEVNQARKADAVKLSHLKTYTADPMLRDYYKEVEKDFKEQFEAIAEAYYPFDTQKRNELRHQIDLVNQVIGKLNSAYATRLHKSLEKYANHVKKSTHSIFQDFIFPVAIPGLSE